MMQDNVVHFFTMLQLMSKCIKVEKLSKGVRTKGATIDMCKALEDMRTESRMEGEEKGIVKGLAKGRMEERCSLLCDLYMQGLLPKKIACNMLSISQHEFDVLLKKEGTIQ